MKFNNTIIFVILILGLVFLGLYCLNSKKKDEETYINLIDNGVAEPNIQHDINILDDTPALSIDDDFTLYGVGDEDDARFSNFGVGPGLYGSGRFFSEY